MIFLIICSLYTSERGGAETAAYRITILHLQRANKFAEITAQLPDLSIE